MIRSHFEGGVSEHGDMQNGSFKDNVRRVVRISITNYMSVRCIILLLLLSVAEQFN